MDANHIQSIKEILPEAFLGNFFFQVACSLRRRCERSRRMVWLPPTRENSPSCRDPQDLALDLHGHFADLVQKQRAVIALLEASNPLAMRASEGTLFVTE